MQTLLQSVDRTNFDDDWVELFFRPGALFDQSLAVTHALKQPLVESIQVPDIAKVSWIICIGLRTLRIWTIEGDEVEDIFLTSECPEQVDLEVISVGLKRRWLLSWRGTW